MLQSVSKSYSRIDAHSAIQDRSSAELLLFVYRRVIDNLSELKNQLKDKIPSISLSKKIIKIIEIGLIQSLKSQDDSEVSRSLRAVYGWSIAQIYWANKLNDHSRIEEVQSVFKTLLEAWTEVVSQSEQVSSA